MLNHRGGTRQIVHILMTGKPSFAARSTKWAEKSSSPRFTPSHAAKHISSDELETESAMASLRILSLIALNVSAMADWGGQE